MSAAAVEPSYRLQRSSAWPGGGLQLVAAAVASLTISEPPRARLLRADGEELESKQSTVAAASGVSALLLTPSGDSAQHAARLEAASALLNALPEGEHIGIWLGAERLPLLAETSDQRDHLLARIAAIPAMDLGALEAEALRRVRLRLNQIAAVFGPFPATLIVIGPALPEEALSSDPSELDELRIDLVDSWELHAGEDVDTASSRELAAAVEQLVAAQARARAATLRIAACGGFEAGDALTLQLGDQSLALVAPPASGLADPACELDAIATDAFPLGDMISLELTPEELELHDRYAAERVEGEFTLQVKLVGAPAIAATAHFRGQSSLKCERKSYSVKFVDERRRRLFADASVSEFYLLSLCTEQGWFRQVVANRLMRELGLSPMEQRYVRLQVAGRERGVYLLIEKPKEKLRDIQSALSAVIRRRDETEGTPAELDYPGSNPARMQMALDEYSAIGALVDATEPDQLYDALSQRLDFASYLRWLGLQTIFQSGDYVDEVFFYASDESAAADGGWYFRNLGWDNDDLFAACHNRGEAAHVDPHQIVYCAESQLDRALFVSDDIYARFADGLEELMDGLLAPERVESELARVRADLFSVLSDDAVCLGSLSEVGGRAATCDVLVPWVTEQIDEFMRALRDRNQQLRERLAAYRAQR